jgi:putative DNA methylase
LPLEAQRLGLESYARDLNPVAVLINKAIIEIPPKFAGRPPVNPTARAEVSRSGGWHGKGAKGLADDVRHYGQWMHAEAKKRIGHLYPNVEITAELAKQRPELKPLVGQKLTAIAWLWARTVKSPNPAFGQVDVPLTSTFMLSTKAGKEAYVEPVIEGGTYRFTVKLGKPTDAERAQNGTKLSRGANFECLMSGTPIGGNHIKSEAAAGRMNARLMAIVAVGERSRLYLPPTEEHEAVARKVTPEWAPDGSLPQDARAFTVCLYGMTKWSDLFTQRQLAALTVFADLVQGAREQVKRDALAAGLLDDNKALDKGGTGAMAYADAVAVYLAFAVDKTAEYGCTLVPWYAKEDRPKGLFARQAIPMIWDYAESNPLSDIGGGLLASNRIIADALAGCPEKAVQGHATQSDAVGLRSDHMSVFSTDPPYYDNVGYADLSDFFYVWLRRSLRPVFPDLFATLSTPKAGELVATPERHGGKAGAERFFLDGMTQAMHRLAEQAHPAFPVTIYYAFKQSESDGEGGTVSTGWEAFLDAVIRAGFAIGGTWPMRTERESRSRGIDSNALASSIVLVCHPRAANARTATRGEFVAALNSELPLALIHLQRGNIAPVDLAQSAIGPGMAVFTRYSKVLDAAGAPLSVREALALINHTLDLALTEQEGDFDADSRWALAWFEQVGFAEGDYGVAEMLSKAKNTSVSGMVEAGILASGRGKVRLLRPSELPVDWDPEDDRHTNEWEMLHHLVRVLEHGGEGAAAQLVTRYRSKAEVVRELAYRLYTLCERKKRPQEATSYNALVQSWPEILRLSQESVAKGEQQAALFDEE